VVPDGPSAQRPEKKEAEPEIRVEVEALMLPIYVA
jgi:hypothetical protein